MEAAKRRVVIKQNAAKKKEVGGQVLVVMGSSEPSTKRKFPKKQGRLPKKPKTVLELVVGLEAKSRKTITPAKHGAGNGLMKGSFTTQEKPPILLREDSKYALEKFSSILTSEDYEDLSNMRRKQWGSRGFSVLLKYDMFVHILFITNPSLFSGNGGDEGPNGTVLEP